MQLLSPAPGIPVAGEAGQLFGDLLERYAIAAVISTAGTKCQLAPGKDVGHGLRDLADLIVLTVAAHVERRVVDDADLRGEHAPDGLRNVQGMHERPPRCAVAGHRYPSSRPSQPGEVVQHDVKPHSR